jgi:hypothetical protein
MRSTVCRFHLLFSRSRERARYPTSAQIGPNGSLSQTSAALSKGRGANADGVFSHAEQRVH